MKAIIGTASRAAFLICPIIVQADCLSPFQTVFACDIEGQADAVEICAIHSDYFVDVMTYTFGEQDKAPELSFQTNGYHGSTKYDRFGIALKTEDDYFYAIYPLGSYKDGFVHSGLLDVFESEADFHAGRELVQLVCEKHSEQGDYRFFSP